MRCTSVAANSYIVGHTKKKKMAAPMKEPGGYDAEEEAWLTGSHKSQHKFNFFDDSVTDDAHELVKQWKAQKDDDEDEADDIIEWDGTPSTPISYKKPSTAADAGFDSPLLSVKPPAARLPSNPAQTPTRAVTPASAGVNHKRSYSLTAASGKTGPGFSSEKIDVKPPSIAEVVSRSNPSQLEIEVSDLKRALQMMKRERWRQPSATETVRAIIQGEPYGLEMCKSKEQKLAFLDEAIKLHDGNAITAAVLFLQKSLKPALFNSELSRRPAAVNHYLSYLRAHFKIDQLEEVLGMLGRTEEAAMLKYKQAVAVKDPRSKIHQLQRCLSAHFCDPSMAAEASLVDEQISLLERQGPIEDSDVRAEREGRVLAFRENPRAASIINMPVVTTLYYCCFYHYDLPENNLASPAAIRKRHQLTDKQFLWTALNARARLKRWKDVEVLLTAKGWFGSTKMKSAIGFDRVAVLLHKAGATNDVLGKYLVLIEDVERRLALAKKLNCPEAVIDTYVALRDRAELEAYLKQLKPRSKEYHYAEDALRNSAHKWKT